MSVFELNVRTLSYYLRSRMGYVKIRDMSDEVLYSEYLLVKNNPQRDNTGLRNSQWLPNFTYELELRGL